MGNKKFEAVPHSFSGFFLNGDVKDMKMIINARKEKLILVGVDNDSLRIFKCR
jgi:hypothetical protein